MTIIHDAYINALLADAAYVSTVGWAKVLSAQHLIMDTSCDIEEQI
ncbi:hypothetical protein HA050_19055 [Iodobacter sp. HSC-16F04]|uniref:Uncharacterized protein n=1 Tax=Iodobacter violaceini TaxID=3044271 RepID=A0ABX0L0E3_9NEIS|nr:hypothetical protein [Iodobacter violacea]NHQ88207.1 hypothetical protein [Iodobacter violacea]